MTMPNKCVLYTPEEKAWLRKHYKTSPKAEIMAALPNRPWFAIQCLANRLKATGRPFIVPEALRPAWNTTNLELLHKLYPSGGLDAVARATGLSVGAVRSCVSRQGMRKSRAKGATTGQSADKPADRRRSLTPNANAAVTKRRQDVPDVPITAKEVSKLDYNHPGRRAYSLDGIRGWAKWKKTLPSTTLPPTP